MNNSSRKAMDIALATEARAMYANLLTDADRDRIASMRTTDELVSFLLRSPAWRGAALSLPPMGTTDAQFAEALGAACSTITRNCTGSQTTPQRSF